MTSLKCYRLLLVGQLQVAKYGESWERRDSDRVGQLVSRSLHYVGHGDMAQVHHQSASRYQGNTYRYSTVTSNSVLIFINIKININKILIDSLTQFCAPLKTVLSEHTKHWHSISVTV